MVSMWVHHCAPSFSSRDPPQRECSWEPLSYLRLKKGRNSMGKGFDNLQWLTGKCLHFFWSLTNKNSLAKLLKCKPQNGPQNQLLMLPPALADVAYWV
jgi:hypothetical protein